MSWPTPLAWVVLIGTLATLASLVLAWGAWDTRKILARMNAADRAYHETSQAMLERMDRAAEPRAQDLNARLGGQEEGQP